jgi:eukaryotic-like serine/threonine-protein kinase
MRFDDSALWEQQARAGLARIGGDEELESELWTGLFFRAYEQQRRDEQVVTAGRAARLAEKRFGLDDLRTIRAQQNELTALSNAYRTIEGWRKRGPLLARQEALLGAQHPTLARSLMDLGDDEANIGHLADARAHLERAERLVRAAGETETLQWTALRDYQQRLALTEGRLDEADAMGKESLAILDKLKILDSERALDQRVGLARAMARRGHGAEATAMLKRQIADSERSHGPDNAEIAEILDVLTDVCVGTGQLAEARAAAERNLALVKKLTPDSRYALADARVGLSRVRLAEGKAGEALTLVEESEPALRAAVGDEAPVVLRALRLRGEALVALGRFDDAVAPLRSALEVATSIGLDPVEQKAMRAALERAQAKKPRVSSAP